MKYTKPEIDVLGDAALAIQLTGKGSGTFDGVAMPPVSAAYDLDD